MKICVLVKEVPEHGVDRRLDAPGGRLDRSGERRLNPFDAHALEAAAQVREAGAARVEEIVAITMGPPSAARVLRRALALGADRAVHLCDPALAGSCMVATGYALARVLERERPDLVLAGQQSDDGECYALPAVVGEELGVAALTQVSHLELDGGVLRCERQAEYGYDLVELELPAVVSVTDTINSPRYPSLRAMGGAREQSLRTLSTADAGIDRARVGAGGSGTAVLAAGPPPARAAGEMIAGADPDVVAWRIADWLGERRLLPE